MGNIYSYLYSYFISDYDYNTNDSNNNNYNSNNYPTNEKEDEWERELNEAYKRQGLGETIIYILLVDGYTMDETAVNYLYNNDYKILCYPSVNPNKKRWHVTISATADQDTINNKIKDLEKQPWCKSVEIDSVATY